MLRRMWRRMPLPPRRPTPPPRRLPTPSRQHLRGCSARLSADSLKATRLRAFASSVSPVRESELLGRITSRPASAQRAALSQSLRLLYEGGRFEQIEAAVTELPTARSPSNSAPGQLLQRSGHGHGTAKEAQRRAGVNMGRLELGAIFSQVKLDESARRILRLMHDHGYWKAEVHAHPNRTKTRSRWMSSFRSRPETAHVAI